MSRLEAMRARLRLLFDRRAAESRMDEELRFHVEMETDRLVREQGLDPGEARRRALVAFGGVERYREELRDGRGLAWLTGMTLDMKLGLRMMVKYPGLTLVGIIGMAVAVAIGAASFGVIYTIVDPTLPLDEGDRVVLIQNLDARRNDAGRRTHLHDLATWHEALRAVEDLGAFRTADRNLITPDGRPHSVRIAELTASGFRVARVPPLLGRYLHDDDERAGAPPVVVIGHAVWQNRFAGQPDVVGRTLQLGATAHTVIGVMPRGFAFPINNRIWTPLRLNPSDFERGSAPPIEVFGRLVPAATMHDARTQLATIGQRLATVHPETHQHIRPRVLPYASAFLDSPDLAWAFHLVQLLVSMILVVIGTNVAILVYARTATRTGEIAVRSALGASRGRIVSQLFAEALVLSAAAASVGLAAAWFVLEQVDAFIARMGGEQVPFWWSFGISAGMILYVAGLAVMAAVIVGVVPALGATRRRVHVGLQALGTGGSGMRLGRTWTMLIVAQVAIAVAIMPVVLHGVVESVRQGMTEPTVATTEFLTASLHLDREGAGTDDFEAYETADFTTRYEYLLTELVRRLRTEPGISDVVLTSAVPGDEPIVRIEVERAPAAGEPDDAATSGSGGRAVGVARVGLDYFAAFDVPILAGRPFQAADLGTEASAVIVNQSFVQRVLGGGDPLGRRVRRAVGGGDTGAASAAGESWFEIAGVVPDFPLPLDPQNLRPRLYEPLVPAAAEPAARRTVLRRTLSRTQPMVPGATHPVTLAVRVRGTEALTFAGRLRELTVAVDPMLRLGNVATLDETMHEDAAANRLVFLAVVLLALSALLLSAAGIYALVSFTITRRRREIGIRSALGAGPRRVLKSVLSRVFGHIAIGIVIGVGLAGVMDRAAGGEMMGGKGAVLLPTVAALMAAVGLIAATGPARRALRIQPSEALKAE